MQTDSRDRSTLRCGRNNPGSNPGHGIYSVFVEKMPALGKSLKSRRGSRPWRKWLEPRSDFST